MPLPIGVVDARCDACLGNRQCWICLGQGRIERIDGGFTCCARCAGTGRCSYCAGERHDESQTGRPQADAPQPAARVIRLEQPQHTSFF